MIFTYNFETALQSPMHHSKKWITYWQVWRRSKKWIRSSETPSTSFSSFASVDLPIQIASFSTTSYAHTSFFFFFVNQLLIRFVHRRSYRSSANRRERFQSSWRSRSWTSILRIFKSTFSISTSLSLLLPSFSSMHITWRWILGIS